MARFARALLLAGALGTAHLAQAELSATKATVAPAAEAVADAASDPAARYQLTDAVLANLTNLQLSNISLFQFGDANNATANKRSASSGCKTYPGDFLYPNDFVWNIFDLLTGGALIKTVPIGAACYPKDAHYDAAKCANILAHWTESATHANDPTSVMSPLYQGETCQPQNGNTSTCEMGGFPSYAVNISTVAQVQLAINFARNLNLRLVVKNTGHDFLGKSVGYGALSIWTHNLKSIDFIENYNTPSYQGPAFKLGAGVEVGELYAAANENGVSALGGECKGVGVTGGYIAGGGHSPLTSKFGMAADHALSIDIVTPNGRFLTVDENNNKDLFWAIRGGGGATFGVVTSMTVKVHPKLTVSGVTWDITAGPDTNVSTDLFWQIMDSYWRKFPSYAANGSYGYSDLFPRGPGLGYTWSMLPWMVPGMELPEFKTMVAPLFAEWKSFGLNLQPQYFTYDNFYDAWSNHFPIETVANANLRTASRLFPKSNWDDEDTLNKTIAAIRGVIEEGSAFIGYNINGAALPGTPDNAVNPAWREAVMYGIIGSSWATNATVDVEAAANKKITRDWMQRLRDVTPGSGGYLNEGDVMEPNFGQAFFGTNYDRLVSIKKATDPWDVFWAPTAVNSEGWYITGQYDWLTLETGRLCRK